MTARYSTGARNALNDSGLAAFDGGSARINIYNGTYPTDPNAAISGPTLLATLTPSSDVWAASSSGAAAANSITQDSAADSAGRPNFGVLYRTGDTALTSTASSTDRRLFFACGVRTTLAGALNSSATTIPLTSTLGFATSGEVIVDSERITYSGISGNSLTGATRGANGTSAASHSDLAVTSEYGVECTFDNANFGGSGATAGFVLNAQITMSLFTVTWPAAI